MTERGSKKLSGIADFLRALDGVLSEQHTRIETLERAALWHVMHSNDCHPGDACPDSAPCGCREECENMIDEAKK